MGRSFLKVFFDFDELTEQLNDEEKGRLLLAMVRYAETGAEPELPGAERILWPAFRKAINEQVAAYETKVSNGSKGGRPSKNETEEKQTEPEETEINRTKPNETENNRNAQEQEQEKEKDINYDEEDDNRAREAEIRTAFLQELGEPATPADISLVMSAARAMHFGEGVAGYAVHIAAVYKARSPAKYAKQVLEEWADHGLHSMDEVTAYQIKKDVKKGRVTNDRVVRSIFGLG